MYDSPDLQPKIQIAARMLCINLSISLGLESHEFEAALVETIAKIRETYELGRADAAAEERCRSNAGEDATIPSTASLAFRDWAAQADPSVVGPMLHYIAALPEGYRAVALKYPPGHCFADVNGLPAWLIGFAMRPGQPDSSVEVLLAHFDPEDNLDIALATKFPFLAADLKD